MVIGALSVGGELNDKNNTQSHRESGESNKGI